MPEISQASRQLEGVIRRSHVDGPVRADGTVDQARFPFFGKLVRLFKPSERKSTWTLALETLGRLNPGISASGMRKVFRRAGLKEGGEITVRQLRDTHSVLQEVVAKHQKEVGDRVFVPLEKEPVSSRCAAFTNAVGDALDAVGVLHKLISSRASEFDQLIFNDEANYNNMAIYKAALAVEKLRGLTSDLFCRTVTEERQFGRGEDLERVGNKINELLEKARAASSFADLLPDDDSRAKSSRSDAIWYLNSAIDEAAAAGVDELVVAKARKHINAAVGGDFARALAFRGIATKFASIYSDATKAAFAADKASAAVTAAANRDQRDAAFERLVSTADSALKHLNDAIDVFASAGLETPSVAEAKARVDAARRSDPSGARALVKALTDINAVIGTIPAERIATAARVADAIDSDLNTARQCLEADVLYHDLLVGRAVCESHALGRALSEGEQTKLADEVVAYVQDMSEAEAKAAYDAGQKTVNLVHKFAAGLAEVDVESSEERGRLVSSLSAFVISSLDSASYAALGPEVNLREPEVIKQSQKMAVERAMAELTDKEAIEIFTAATETEGAGRALLAGAAGALAEENRRLGAQANTGTAHSAQALYDATEYLLRALGKRGGFTEHEIKDRLSLNIGEWSETLVRSARDCKADVATKFTEVGARITASPAPRRNLADARVRLANRAADSVRSGNFVELLRHHQIDTSSNLAAIQAYVLKQINELLSKMPASKLNSLEGDEAAQREADRLVARVVRTSADEITLKMSLTVQITEDRLVALLSELQTEEQFLKSLPPSAFTEEARTIHARHGSNLGAGEREILRNEARRIRTEEAREVQALVVDKAVRLYQARGGRLGVANRIEDVFIRAAVVEALNERYAAKKNEYLAWTSDSVNFSLLSDSIGITKEGRQLYDHLLRNTVELRGNALCVAKCPPHVAAQEILQHISQLGREEVRKRWQALSSAQHRAVAFVEHLGKGAPRSAKATADAAESLGAVLKFFAQGIYPNSEDTAHQKHARGALLVELGRELPLRTQLKKSPEACFNDALSENTGARQIFAQDPVKQEWIKRGYEGLVPGSMASNAAIWTARLLAVIGIRAKLSAEEIKGRLSQAGASEDIIQDAMEGLA